MALAVAAPAYSSWSPAVRATGDGDRETGAKGNDGDWSKLKAEKAS